MSETKKRAAGHWLAVHKRRGATFGQDLGAFLKRQQAFVIERLAEQSGVKKRDDGFYDPRLLKSKPLAVPPEIVDQLLPSTFDRELNVIANRHVLRASVRGSELLVWRANRHVRRRKNKRVAKALIDIPDAALEAIQAMLEESYDRHYWKKVNVTSREKLKRLILQALEEHASVPDAAKMIENSGIFSYDRGYTVARTETTSALNAGHWAVARSLGSNPEVGLTGREWLDVGDNDTRDSHRVANGQVVGVNAPFIVGGYEARFPGDPFLPAEDRVNCRCTTVETFQDD